MNEPTVDFSSINWSQLKSELESIQIEPSTSSKLPNSFNSTTIKDNDLNLSFSSSPSRIDQLIVLNTYGVPLISRSYTSSNHKEFIKIPEMAIQGLLSGLSTTAMSAGYPLNYFSTSHSTIISRTYYESVHLVLITSGTQNISFDTNEQLPMLMDQLMDLLISAIGLSSFTKNTSGPSLEDLKRGLRSIAIPLLDHFFARETFEGDPMRLLHPRFHKSPTLTSPSIILPSGDHLFSSLRSWTDAVGLSFSSLFIAGQQSNIASPPYWFDMNTRDRSIIQFYVSYYHHQRVQQNTNNSAQEISLFLSRKSPLNPLRLIIFSLDSILSLPSPGSDLQLVVLADGSFDSSSAETSSIPRIWSLISTKLKPTSSALITGAPIDWTWIDSGILACFMTELLPGSVSKRSLFIRPNNASTNLTRYELESLLSLASRTHTNISIGRDQPSTSILPDFTLTTTKSSIVAIHRRQFYCLYLILSPIVPKFAFIPLAEETLNHLLSLDPFVPLPSPSSS